MIETVHLIEDLTDRALGRAPDDLLLSRPPRRAEIHRHMAAMVESGDVDQLPTPAGRSRWTKRLVLKLAGFTLSRQRTVNFALIGVVNALVDELDHVNAELEQLRRSVSASVASVEMSVIAQNRHQREIIEGVVKRVELLAEQTEGASTTIKELDEATARSRAQGTDVQERVAKFEDLVRSFAQTIEEHEGRVHDLMAETTLESSRREVLEHQIGLLKREMAQGGSGETGAEHGARAAHGEIPPVDLREIYERFEAAFRPAGADLDRRFQVYLDELSELPEPRNILDLGTGRGDFLNVLASAGMDARGVDLNPEAVASARARGLNVALADAFEYLASLPNESVAGVTAIHVVEHVEPSALVILIDEIVRVLVPGGRVILETPNPTNLSVGASSFYHDPTHNRPITPAYLSFLLSDRGLSDVRTKFLNPLPEYELPHADLGQTGLRSVEMLLDDVRWALKGPQDYAVIGRRPGRR